MNNTPAKALDKSFTLQEKMYDIVISPVVTEKSTALAEQNKFVFKVARDASKTQIKQAVEALFGVSVEAVNTINVQGKIKKFRGVEGVRNSFKKAVVRLAANQTIDMSNPVLAV